MQAIIVLAILLVPNVAYASSWLDGAGSPLLVMGRTAVAVFVINFVLGCFNAGKAVGAVTVVGGLILLGQLVYYLRKLLYDAGLGALWPF